MIRGTKRPRVKAVEIIEPEAQKIDAQLNVSIHNRFDIEVVDARTGEIKQRAQAENVICNALWARLLAPNTYFNFIHYGTGAGTPAAADTSLFTFLGYGTPSAGDDVYENNFSQGWMSLRRKIQLSETTAVGSTLTEVGIGHSNTAATLVTHAMLKDMNGNPISIAKTDTDIISIYATVFLHWAVGGYDSGHLQFAPYYGCYNQYYGNYGFVYYLLGLYGTQSGRCVPSSVRLASGRLNTSSGVSKALSTVYSAASKTITLTAARFAVSESNGYGPKWAITNVPHNAHAGGYPSGLNLCVGGVWYPYSTISGEAIGTGDGNTKDFATAFPFPYDATVYVDGVEQTSGVSVGEEPLLVSDIGQYFEGLHAASTVGQHIPLANQALSTVKEASFTTGDYLYYNPIYSVGVASLYRSNCAISVSNDLETWTQIAAYGTGTVSVNSTYQNYKYWKVTVPSAGYVQSITAPSAYTGKPIHFTTEPASGAVITADYKTKTIAKDANHVFDLTVTIQLGEYTE